MEDRGEKIVTLAREILRNDALPHLPEAPQIHVNMSFKVLCLATVLAAVGGSAVTGWAVETRRPINHYEKTELDALIFYAARQKNLSEDDLRRDMLAKLNVQSLDAMTEQDFDAARDFLQNKVN